MPNIMYQIIHPRWCESVARTRSSGFVTFQAGPEALS